MLFDTEDLRGRAEEVLRGGAALVCAAALAGCADPGGTGSADGTAETVVSRGDVSATERADLEPVFSEAGVTGAFVLHDTRAHTSTVVNPQEASERAFPAATFEIPAALIGLEAGGFGSVDAILAAGPENAGAFTEPNGPAFQEAVRRVGHEQMAAWVDRFDYGSRDIGGADAGDSFWLEGPLEVSAVEQTEFLSALTRSALPVDREHQAAVREAALMEEGEGYALHGKTGGDGADAPGWWVGWVDSEAGLYTFALRLDAQEGAGAEAAVPLGRQLLVELEVLPPEASGG
ncbi:penicillin-binding transpeptidase domain-containing protein [Nocardiopsis algeriensis]|uniref:penicillin-binding transpeptidase domain-containing protein n=1 Tax=Nocardiopsis algeriensis TaxID=1478215 RepID=UPI003B432ECF